MRWHSRWPERRRVPLARLRAPLGRAIAWCLAVLPILAIAPLLRLNAAPALVAAYNFNEASGSTLRDVSGNNNTGTLVNGPVWTSAGKYGGALTFDGANDLITIADAPSLDLTVGVTLEAWVKPIALTGWRTVVLKEIPGDLSYALYANQSAQRPGMDLRIGSATPNVSGTSALSTTAWTHIAGTYDGAVARFYVNGVEVAAQPVSGSLTTSANPFRIGGNLVWGEYFQGAIDEVRVYNGALTPSEIQADMGTALPDVPAIDTTPPEVSSISPPNGASQAVPSGNLVATFSERLDPATVTAATLQLRVTGGGAIAGAVSYDDVSKSATFDPTNALALSTGFTATILGGAAGVKDRAGNALAADVSWSFTTAADGTPPAVVSKFPSPQATNVLLTTAVTATFSEPIDPASLSLMLRNQSGAAVPGTVTYDSATRKATLRPNAPLAAATVYSATVERAKDLVGNELVAPVSWGFTTGAAAFADSVVITGLTEPTAIEFAADGRVFVAEKSGIIKVFDSLADTTPALFADLRTNVHNFWDRGLLGMALHPAFPAEPYVYVLYAHDASIGGTAPRWGVPGGTSDSCPTPPGPTADGCVISGRLSRLQAAGNQMIGPEQVLVEDWGQQYPSHSIGSLMFGADGALYASGGDGASFNFADYGQDGNPLNPLADPPVPVGGTQTPPTAEGGALRSQDLRTTGDHVTLNGAIVRLDPATGEAMAGNPLIADGDPNARRIIAHGFRNPFRFTIRPGTNELYIGDVGWSAFDEINRIADGATTPLRNFGWPCYEGSGRQSSYDAANLNICENLYAQAGAVTAPLFAYQHGAVLKGESCPAGSSSISGLAFYTGTRYPAQYRDALFFADYSRGCIWVMFKGASGAPDPATITPFLQRAAGPVQLKAGPGGDIFYVDLAGSVHRIEYFAGNSPPQAAMSASPVSGPAPLTVSFDAAASSDPEGAGPLAYAWDLDGDLAFDDGSGVTASYTYTTAGTHVASVRVTDGDGLSDVASVTIAASSDSPVATIDTPVPTLLWRVGDTVAFSGGAEDREDGMLPAAALSWRLVLHHCSLAGDCHAHPLQTVEHVSSGVFTAPDHEYPSHLELILTATDSHGQTGTASVRLDPSTVVLSFDTAPTGIDLVVGSAAAQTPFARTVIVGSTNTIIAPSPSLVGGQLYEFLSWSDGGSPTHTIVASEAGGAYVATYASVPTISIDDARVNETAGGSVATFTVALSAASTQTVTVAFGTVNGSAAAGADYVARSGTLMFPAGTTTATIAIAISDDLADESDETFFVNLSNASHAAFADGQGIGTIVDDDPPAVTGLIAAYAFEEGAGTTTADATGKGHTGTISGATWVAAGRTGRALSFDGVNDWVTITAANDLNLTTGMTLEAWVRPSALSGWRTVVLKEGSATNLAYALYAHDNSPRPAVTVRISNVNRSAAGTSPLPLNAWSHLAATYDGAMLRLYVNGVQVGTRAQTGSMLTSTRALRIGGNAVWSNEFFRGLIDDVRIYNRALSAGEIQTDMNNAVR